MKKMGEMGRKRWLDDLYGKLLRLHLHYIWPRRKPYGLIARARGKSLPGSAHGLEPAAQQLRPLRERLLDPGRYLPGPLIGPLPQDGTNYLREPSWRML